MSSKELKQIRGQIRQVIKEILPEVLTAELVAAIEKQLNQKMDSALTNINDRQKDIQSYLIRQSTKAAPTKE